MGNYYYVSASLPPIDLDRELEISFSELRFRYQMNFSKKDSGKVEAILQMIDIGNILHSLRDEPIDPRGALSQKELEEALLNKSHFSPSLFVALDRFETRQEKIGHFQEIYALFFAQQIACQEGFLKRYFEFERSLRLVLLAYRAKRLGRDVMRELQFEDFADPLVAYILAQKEASSFEFPFEFQDLALKLEQAHDARGHFQAIEEYKLKKIDELSSSEEFSIDWLLAYMVKLLIVENYKRLDEERGLHTLKQSLSRPDHE